MTAGGRRDFVDILNGTPERDESEEAADRFARDELIPPERYAEFVAATDYSEPAVRRFARELGIAPGIVVARLQREGHLARNRLNSLKRPVSISVILDGSRYRHPSEHGS